MVLVDDTLELDFGWKCLLPTVTYFLMFVASGSFMFLSENDLKKTKYVAGRTEEFSNILLNGSIQLFDTLCMLNLLLIRKSVQGFFARFAGKVANLFEIALSDKEYQKEITARQQRLNKVILFIGSLSMISVGNNFYVFIVRVRSVYAGMEAWKICILAWMAIYWVILNQIRMLTFYLWIALVICFKIAFTSLSVVTDPKGERNSGMFVNRKKISWAIKEYVEVEALLREFHTLFSLQVLNMCFTSLIASVNPLFNLARFAMNQTDFMELVPTVITLVCNWIGVNSTFVVLCHVCTDMTKEVRSIFYLNQT